MATTKKSAIIEKKTEGPKAKLGKYLYGVGRRKTAVAQVRLYSEKENKGAGHSMNRRALEEYFPAVSHATPVSPLQVTGLGEEFQVSATVQGGGVQAQAEAVRLGVARALLKHDESLRATLRANGFLTRDARSVERKKPGLKKARRAPQWAKR